MPLYPPYLFMLKSSLKQAQDFENKLDKKIDLLSRAGVLSKRKISTIGEVDDDEQDVENSLVSGISIATFES